jgi:hypothetical protein
MLPVLRESADRVRLFSPSTGEEVIPADAATNTLAEVRDAIRTVEEDLRLAKQTIDAELIGRMDSAAKWSVSVGGFKLSAPSPAPSVEYDAQALRGRLEELVADGLLSMQAVDAAVEVVTTFKVRAAGVNALRKLGGLVAEAVQDCSQTVDKPRRVTVSRAA